MYIRTVSQKNKITGESYLTHRLVESYRNADSKVRQQVLLNLGAHFPVPAAQWKLLADRVEQLRRGQQPLFPLPDSLEAEAQHLAHLVLQREASLPRMSTPPSSPTKPAPDATDYQTVDLSSLALHNSRLIGAEYIAYHAVRQLQLDTLLQELGFPPKHVNIALATIIGRLIYPGSERRTLTYLRTQSALDELLGVDFSCLGTMPFYAIADRLYRHKASLEQRLYQREKDLFQLPDIITLYDITNTYFEGRCLSHPHACYGRSKEKRSDCPLISLGLALDASGFPKRSEILPGNVSEPKTLAHMLSALQGDQKALIIMDAGIATEANLAWLSAQGYTYLVVSRKARANMPEGVARTVVKSAPQADVEAALVRNETTSEWELYCHSEAKAAKSTAMVRKANARYEMELTKLRTGLSKKRGMKSSARVLEKLGRLKEKYKKVSALYQVAPTLSEDGSIMTDLTWTLQEAKTHVLQEGVYCLRTNQRQVDAKALWKTYTLLTEVEAAFRSLKSELGFRPVYHQKEARIDAHLFISVLAFHLLQTVRHQLKVHGITERWETIRDVLSTHCRLTTSLRLQDGRMVHIRKTASPTVQQASIYRALGLEMHPLKTQKIYVD